LQFAFPASQGCAAMLFLFCKMLKASAWDAI
jgi:hypothetical protein